MKRPSNDPGTLRHRLRLESRNEQADGLGGFAANWQLVAGFDSLQDLSRFRFAYQYDTLRGPTFLFPSKYGLN